MSVRADVVAQARAAGPDRRPQRVLDRLCEPRALLARQTVGPGARMDAGAEQALGRVNVADADDAASVHQELLDRGAMRARQGVEPRRIERARKRLDTEIG